METQQAAADRLLDRGVRFKIPAPAFIRFLGLNRLTIRPFRPGTILEFSRVVLEHQLQDMLAAEKYEQLIESIEPIARCIAIAALNSRMRIKWLTPIMTKWLMWRTSYSQLLEMFMVLVELNKIQDFTPITRFFCHQTRMMMSPKNLGHQANGE